LGTLALIGAPFLLIGFKAEQHYAFLANSWFTGAWGLVYITAWLCSILVLHRLGAAGKSRFGRVLLPVVMGMLGLANVSNLYKLLLPDYESALFYAFDAFWPLSNLAMVVVGVAVIRAKVLPGWRRYVPLAVGLWFPLTMLGVVLVGRTSPYLFYVPYYSAIAWTLLALAVRGNKYELRMTNYAVQAQATAHTAR
ncbi:MAG TPA: hypothetical protein VF646_13120, partial [Cytophagales bacterium]